jgi:amino acid transporter
MFNVLPAVPGAVVAFFILWGLPAFAGANLVLDMVIVFVFSAMLAAAFGFLAIAMPRSGGDYIFNSRTLHPALGLAGSVTLIISGLLSIGYWSLWMVEGAIGPTLIQIGAAFGNNQTLESLGHDLTVSGPATFIVALAMLIAVTWCLLRGMRLVMRIQRWLFIFAMSGFVLTMILLLFVSHQDFVNGFNAWAAQYTHQANSYASLTTAAAKNGYAFTGHRLGPTIWATGVIMSTGVWAWYSVLIAGEVKRANTRSQLWSILAGQVMTYGAMICMTLLLYRVIGEGFLGSLNSLSGTANYPLPAPPFYVLLVSIIWNNPLLAVFLGLTFIAWFPLELYVQWIQPVRGVFAYAFDGLLPKWVTRVNPHFHTPITATIICSLVGVGCLVWANFFSQGFFVLLALAAIVGFPAMFLVGVSATIFPWRRRELFRTSAANVRIFGVPVMTIMGVGAMITAMWGLIDYLSQKALLPSPGEAAAITFGTFVGAFIYYFIARAVRRHRGEDIELNYAVIPPE